MDWALNTAARTFLQEVRGEPPDGQNAFCHVLVNRLKSGRWGKTLATVCLWRAQFSGWGNPSDPNFAFACNLADGDPTLASAAAMIQAAFAAPDITQGALFYFAPAGMPGGKAPPWAGTMQFCGQFGSQRFFKDGH
jgi:spore germination cell wall hydrolase CwlJ-like protein